MLWMLDDGVPDDLIKALELYCSAFFYGCKIVIRRPGEKMGFKKSTFRLLHNEQDQDA